ncbi:MAG TPA: hypothetical protein VFR34_15340 [Paracoccaceae bacterium]|nr:hypothetical protein [Paracoccaceae bacterium]
MAPATPASPGPKVPPAAAAQPRPEPPAATAAPFPSAAPAATPAPEAPPAPARPQRLAAPDLPGPAPRPAQRRRAAPEALPPTTLAPPSARRPIERPASLSAASFGPPTRLAVAETRRPAPRPAALRKRPVTLRATPAAAQPADLAVPAPEIRPERTPASDEITTIIALEAAPDEGSDTEAGPAPARDNPAIRQAATEPQALDLGSVSLIGIFGTPKSRRALIRLPSGSYRRVTRGDNVEGWSVAAIGEDSLHLARSGQIQVLRLAGR